MHNSCSQFFLASSHWSSVYLFSLLWSFSGILLKCLSEVSAVIYKLFATWPKAHLVDLTCCLFLWRTTTIFLSQLSPVSRLVAWSSECCLGLYQRFFSLSPSLEICSSSSSSSFRTKDVSPELEVQFITLLSSKKSGLRYFHQCGSFSSASSLPFFIRLCVFDHSCLNDLNLILNFVYWSFNILVQFDSIVLIKLYLSFCFLNPDFCSTSLNVFLTHSKTSLLEDLFKASFSKAIS